MRLDFRWWMAALALALGVCSGCDDGEPAAEEPVGARHSLRMRAAGPDGAGVEGVRILVDGALYARTDADGRFEGALGAERGAGPVLLDVLPPSGWACRTPVEQRPWRVTVPERDAVIELEVELVRRPADQLLIVRAAPASRVHVDGRTVGRTDQAGNALLRIRGVPGAPLRARVAGASLVTTWGEEGALHRLAIARSTRTSPPDHPNPPPTHGGSRTNRRVVAGFLPQNSLTPAASGSAAAERSEPEAVAGAGAETVAETEAETEAVAVAETGAAAGAEAEAERPVEAKAVLCGPIASLRAQLDAGHPLTRDHVAWITALPSRARCYGEAHRLHAAWCHREGAFGCQAAALERATTQGRYRRDPALLVSMAKAYLHQRRYPDAARTMRRARRDLHRLPFDARADALRLTAEIGEIEAERLLAADEPADDAIDDAVQAWQRYQGLVRGLDAAAEGRATERLRRLDTLRD